MKKLTLFVTITIANLTIFAQLPVSTSPEKKKIAFEEFTGIYCSACPAGHLISATLKSAHPNDFFPIYMHESPFAEPRLASDPEYRTAHGPSILSLLNTNYVPVGSINRKIYEGSVIGLDKAKWTQYVDSALLEDAYVNVAFEASLNIITRELIVNSELYFPEMINAYNIDVTSSSSMDFTFNGDFSGSDPAINVNVGDTIIFNVNTPGHPFWINTVQGPGSTNGVSVANNGTSLSIITWVPTSAGTYYYNCEFHSMMSNTITVSSLPSIPSTMKLNLAISQNNVEGPQKNGYNNPSALLPNGNYLHQHQFKEFITGQWGEPITNIVQNTLVTKQHVYNVPLDYSNVTAELFDLEVIGFLAEANTNIINANKCQINYIIPANVNLIDIGIKTNNVITQDLCDDIFTPKVTVYNYSNVLVDSFEVVTSLNGTLLTGQQFYQSILPGDSAILNLSPVSLSNKINSVKYLINVNNYDTYYDTISNNNFTKANDIYHIPSTSITSNFGASFEGSSLSVSIPNSYIINTNVNGKFVSLQQSHFSTASQPIGGFGNSTKSMWIGAQFYKQPEFIEITVGYLDLSLNSGHNFEFSYASQLLQSSSNVKLEFKVSNDCGVTWTSVWSKQGSTLPTVSGLYSGAIFSPTPGDWSREIIDLSSYDGDDDVIIRMEFTPDPSASTCAGIFMDDWELTHSNSINTNNKRLMSIYPNPSNDILNITFNQLENKEQKIEILNSLGEIVSEINISPNTSVTKLNINDLSSGIYIIKLTSNNKSYTEKFIVE